MKLIHDKLKRVKRDNIKRILYYFYTSIKNNSPYMNLHIQDHVVMRFKITLKYKSYSISEFIC